MGGALDRIDARKSREIAIEAGCGSRARSLFRRLSIAGTSSQLRRNALAGAAGAIGGAAIAAVSYPVYLHFLGYEQYGLWLAVALVLSFAQFGNLGLAPAVTTKVAEDLARGDFAGVRATVSTALLSLTAVGVLAVATVLLFGGYIVGAMRLSPALAAQARHLLPLVAVLSLYVVQIETLNSVLVGLGRLDLAVATQFFSRALSLAISASLLANGVGVMSLPLASLCGYAILHLASLVLARRITGHGCLSLRAFDYMRLRSLATFGSGVVACSVMNLMLGPLNKFALIRYAGPGSLPIYELAWTLSMQLRSVLESGFRSLMPEVSRLAALGLSDSPRRIASVNWRAIKLIFAIGLPAFALVFVVAEPGLRFWLGARFRPEIVPALRVLLFGCFLNLLGVPSYYTLLGLGKIKQIIASQAAQSITNAGLILIIGVLLGTASTGLTAAAASSGIAVGGLYCLFAARALTRESTNPESHHMETSIVKVAS
jgi:O-antigen/teichoic acid export membrane protein